MDPVTLAQFRASPLFADSNVFQDNAVTFWLGVANANVSQSRFGDQYSAGVMLMTAHYATLDALMFKENAMGGIGGLRSGTIKTESGDKVAVSYDSEAANEMGAGHWNSTVWGKRYYALAMLYGAGPMHIGGPGYCGGGSTMTPTFDGGGYYGGPLGW